MPIVCVPKKQTDELKKAFKSGKISLEKLYKLGSSSARIKELTKYVGDGAELANIGLEKAFISPAQKTSLKNWVYKNIGQGKPLYKEITLEDGKALSGLKISDLKKLDDTQRINKLSELVGKDKATKLNDRFNKSLKSGNLANWEERTMGTKSLPSAPRPCIQMIECVG